ncbi:MAG TPA: guanylate kinase, partial [Bacteroidaceae bacterium]|nr:guanylate kinase [Bacteroidaceae bacterium]
GKYIIISAPSGSGKSTIVKKIMNHKELNLHFSISVTNRKPRTNEQDGKDYFFLSNEEFQRHIDNNDLLEYEEVYKGLFYGTLKSQIEKSIIEGKNIVFDVDVVGGNSIKNYFKERALSIFIQPPSIQELRSRLLKRGTDSVEMIEKRVAKAKNELMFAHSFDVIIINDHLEKAVEETLSAIKTFLNADKD